MVMTTSAPSEKSRWWYERPGVVYFFGAGKPPVAIKIGMTTAIPGKRDLKASIRQRHKAIQSANHEIVELLGIIPFDKTSGEFPADLAERLEQKLHGDFADLQRSKPHTVGAEWFTPATRLLDFIKTNSQEPECRGLDRFIR